MKRKIMTFALALSLMGATAMKAPAQASEEFNFGTVIGAVGGGLIGSRIGKGDGRLVGTAAGTLIGAVIGTGIANNHYDEVNRRVERRAPKPVRWDKPDHDYYDRHDKRTDRRLDRIERRVERIEEQKHKKQKRKWREVARYDGDVLICNKRGNRCKWVD